MNCKFPLFFLAMLPVGIKAQMPSEQAVLDLLAGAKGLQWSVVGTTAAPGAACRSGDRYYSFQRTPAQVIMQDCVNGTWTPRSLPLTTWTAGDRSGVAFGGRQYEVKQLHATAPVCKGNANCVRLASRPDGTTDATTTIYLTR